MTTAKNGTIEFRDQHKQLHRIGGAAYAYTDDGFEYQEYFENGIWQGTTTVNNPMYQTVLTNKPTFIDSYGTIHRFVDNMRHGITESKAGVKVYYNNGKKIAILYPTGELYFDFVNNLPTCYTTTDGYKIVARKYGQTLIWLASHYKMSGSERESIEMVDNKIQETRCESGGVKINYVYQNGDLVKPEVPVIQDIKSLLDQYIPTDPKDQQHWLESMRPHFEEYSRGHRATQVMRGNSDQVEFLKTAPKLDIQTYINQLQFCFYDGLHHANYIGQALRLFELIPDEIDPFIQAVNIKNRFDFLVYCLNFLNEYNPKLIKFLAAVKWN